MARGGRRSGRSGCRRPECRRPWSIAGISDLGASATWGSSSADGLMKTVASYPKSIQLIVLIAAIENSDHVRHLRLWPREPDGGLLVGSWAQTIFRRQK